MERHLDDILDEGASPVDSAIRWLIDVFYGRARQLRGKADQFLYAIYSVLIVAVVFVIFAAQLTRFDVAARSSAEHDLLATQSEAIATRARARQGGN